jgi:hypothetical protein
MSSYSYLGRADDMFRRNTDTYQLGRLAKQAGGTCYYFAVIVLLASANASIAHFRNLRNYIKRREWSRNNPNTALIDTDDAKFAQCMLEHILQISESAELFMNAVSSGSRPVFNFGPFRLESTDGRTCTIRDRSGRCVCKDGGFHTDVLERFYRGLPHILDDPAMDTRRAVLLNTTRFWRLVEQFGWRPLLANAVVGIIVSFDYTDTGHNVSLTYSSDKRKFLGYQPNHPISAVKVEFGANVLCAQHNMASFESALITSFKSRPAEHVTVDFIVLLYTPVGQSSGPHPIIDLLDNKKELSCARNDIVNKKMLPDNILSPQYTLEEAVAYMELPGGLYPMLITNTRAYVVKYDPNDSDTDGSIKVDVIVMFNRIRFFDIPRKRTLISPTHFWELVGKAQTANAFAKGGAVNSIKHVAKLMDDPIILPPAKRPACRWASCSERDKTEIGERLKCLRKRESIFIPSIAADDDAKIDCIEIPDSPPLVIEIPDSPPSSPAIVIPDSPRPIMSFRDAASQTARNRAAGRRGVSG